MMTARKALAGGEGSRRLARLRPAHRRARGGLPVAGGLAGVGSFLFFTKVRNFQPSAAPTPRPRRHRLKGARRHVRGERSGLSTSGRVLLGCERRRGAGGPAELLRPRQRRCSRCRSFASIVQSIGDGARSDPAAPSARAVIAHSRVHAPRPLNRTLQYRHHANSNRRTFGLMYKYAELCIQ